MKKKKTSPLTANITSSIKPATKGRQWHDRVSRVGIITTPIKGKDTHAKQWNRWTP